MGNSYIENSRLRSLRTRKRLIKEAFEKYIRQQNKLWRKLWNQKRDIPLVPLPEPYQKGFVRFFVLRDDIARSKSADFFNQILEKINTYQYSDNRKFLKKKRKRGKKIQVPREQKLHKIIEWQFPKYKKLEFNYKQQMYFVKTEEYNPHRKVFETYYEFRDPWRFVLRVKPYMITHYRPLDLDLERELAQLDKLLDNHKVRGIIQKKIVGRSYGWKGVEKKKGKEKYKYNNLKNNNLSKMRLSATEIASIFEETF
ncbi:hypothetical protein ACI76Y_02650 [Capnocytophaga cynodegmi]|uniref:hypothetical protein n=1 Tax=Capnocytophaga cynodegmi TaxID=28189 RepID=UPI00385EF582